MKPAPRSGRREDPNLRLMANSAPGASDGEPGAGATPPAGSSPSPSAPQLRHQGAPPGGTPPSPDATGDPPPRTALDAGAWLLYAGLGFVVGQVVSTILLFAAAAATGHSSNVAQLAARTEPPAWVVVSELVGLWTGFVGAAVFAVRARGTGSLRRDLGLEVRSWDVVIGPAIGFAGQLLLLPLVYLPLEHVIPHLGTRLQAPAKHLTGGFPGADLAVIAVLTVVVVPVVEELFFRGLVLRALLRVCARAGPVLGVTLAVVADGVIFGLAHFELLQLLGLATFGVVLSLMAYRFRRLGPGIFAHGVFNLLAVLSVATMH